MKMHPAKAGQVVRFASGSEARTKLQIANLVVAIANVSALPL